MLGDKRYVVLRFYCWLLKASSVLTLLLVVAGFIYSIVRPPVMTVPASGLSSQAASLIAVAGPVGNALLLAVGFVSAIGAWALADYLAAHMSIEENTREMVELMRSRRSVQQPTGKAYTRARDGMWADPPPPPSGLARYEDTPLGQYTQRQQKR